MRISDWSSDVCSSDLHEQRRGLAHSDARRKLDEGLPSVVEGAQRPPSRFVARYAVMKIELLDREPRCDRAPGGCCVLLTAQRDQFIQIGRASCRARGCQYG